MKKNPWSNRFKRPAGPRVQPLFCRKYGFRQCKQLRDTASYRDLRERKGTPEK